MKVKIEREFRVGKCSSGEFLIQKPENFDSHIDSQTDYEDVQLLDICIGFRNSTY